ncbi:MAG: hypothetical protein DRI57_13210, partial [Deltaproteobacteria bacterium]
MPALLRMRDVLSWAADMFSPEQGNHKGLPLRFPPAKIIAEGYQYPVSVILTAGARRRHALPGRRS